MKSKTISIVVILTLLIAAFAILPSSVNASPIINAGFETGDFTGWTVYVPYGATAEVATVHCGDYGTSYTAQDGLYFACLKTGGPGSYTTVSQNIYLSAGETIEGWAAFDARDYMPYNGNAHVRILQGSTVISTPFYSDVSIVGNYGDGPWTFWSWTASESDTYTLEYRISNALDSAVDSYAVFDMAYSVAVGLYAGGSDPGYVYKYVGGTEWEVISPVLGYAVLDLVEYDDHLYASTMSTSNPMSGIGRVYRYDGGTTWTLVGDNMDDQVCDLAVYQGDLYAGTAWNGMNLYRYEGGTSWTQVVYYTPWSGTRALHVSHDYLLMGDIGFDQFAHIDATEAFTVDLDQYYGSCIYDYEDYGGNVYGSAYIGMLWKSPDATTWSEVLGNYDGGMLELERFQHQLYMSYHDGELRASDGTTRGSILYTAPDGIISMETDGVNLFFGTGGEAGSLYLSETSGIASVYKYDGTTVTLISGYDEMVTGVQVLYYVSEPPQPPQPPDADSNGPYEGNEGSPITFDASGSYDPNFDELQFRWDFNNDGTWDTSYSYYPKATHTWSDDYSGIVVVEVYDGEFTDTDTCTATVNNVAPQATILGGIGISENNYILVTNYNTQSYFIDIEDDGSLASPEYIDDKDYRACGAGVGDFDNDGDLDALVGDPYNTWYYEKIGEGNSFAPAVSIDSTYHTWRMDFAEADYNNDGNLDAIMAYFNSNYFTIYLGNGDGTFTINTLSGPYYIIGMDSSDFDGDGNMDFIAASNHNEGASIYLGNGDGTFQPEINLPIGVSWGVCAGDFDNDGFDDFLFGFYPQFYLGNGDGSFGSPINLDFHASALAESDINGDGNLDIVYTYGYNMYYRTGNGDGTFSFVSSTPVSSSSLYAIATSPPGDSVLEVNEGDITPFTGKFSDRGWPDTHSATWAWGDGNPSEDGTITEENNEPLATGEVTGSHSYGDNGEYTIILTVSDDDSGSNSDTAIVSVLNVPPTITSFNGPLDPVNINDLVEVDGEFTDPGFLDTHTANIDWDDGNITAATVDETSGSGTVDGSHYYGQPGVYTITLTVTDDDGDSDSMTLSHYVVVYDPDGGFVTGGGWIMSPEGAYTPDPSLTGKANFGFVSKYKKGQQNPTGNTEFNFKVADLNFHSDSYDWLVITHHKAMYKGVGTINGEGNYGFMISVIDEALTPSTNVDMFRIKIWDKDKNDIIIYDNNIGVDDDADPITAISGGQIVIHNK